MYYFKTANMMQILRWYSEINRSPDKYHLQISLSGLSKMIYICATFKETIILNTYYGTPFIG